MKGTSTYYDVIESAEVLIREIPHDELSNEGVRRVLKTNYPNQPELIESFDKTLDIINSAQGLNSAGLRLLENSVTPAQILSTAGVSAISLIRLNEIYKDLNSLDFNARMVLIDSYLVDPTRFEAIDLQEVAILTHFLTSLKYAFIMADSNQQNSENARVAGDDIDWFSASYCAAMVSTWWVIGGGLGCFVGLGSSYYSW